MVDLTREQLIFKIVALDKEVELLREQVRLLRAAQFQPKSEKMKSADPSQEPTLFDMDALVQDKTEEDQPTTTNNDKSENPKPRKSHVKRQFPKTLERKIVVIDLTKEEKICLCGCEKKCIGKEISEELEREPAKYYVNEIQRLKYVCPNESCETVIGETAHSICIAPVPVRMIPKGMVGNAFLTYIMVAKFVDGLPFYRVQAQLRRESIQLGRETMSRWCQRICEKLNSLEALLLDEVKRWPYLQMDETFFQVLKEEGRENTTKSYMWVIRGGPKECPIILFRYNPSRSHHVAEGLLAGYSGTVQTDGYEGYSFIDESSELTHACCLNHARRKFVKVINAHGKKGKAGIASEVLDLIRQLYMLERQATHQGMTTDERLALRQEKSRPIMDALKKKLFDTYDKVPPKSLLGEAIHYTIARWKQLKVFLVDGLVKLDTNDVENSIRPFVIGRKAWLFSGSPKGAKASATLYSLLVTAIANGWNPAVWLKQTLDRIPHATTQEDLLALMPTRRPPVDEQTAP